MVMTSHNQENQNSTILLGWIALSLFLHLFLLSVWAVIPKNLSREKPLQQSRSIESAPALTFMLNPPKPQTLEKKQETFVVPTLPSQEVATENPNAILESERNTLLKSKEQGVKNDLPLPQQTGDPRTTFSYLQSPALKPSPQQSSPPPAPPQTAQTPEAPEQNLNPERSKEALPLIPDGTPLFAKNNPKKNSPDPVAHPKTQTDNKPNTPASPMSFAREKSQINGAKFSDQGENSPESKASDLGRYKSKMYRAIGSRWYIMIDKQMSLLGVGSIKAKFFVQANGVIRDIQIAEDSGQTEILEKICLRSIRDSGPFEPFSDNLKQQLGEGYWEEITFSIY